MDMMQKFHLGKVADFKNKELKAFKFENYKICAVRIDKEIKAFRDVCPHQHSPLHMGFVQDNWVVCSFHGWLFDMDSGDCGVNPNCKLAIYKVSVDNQDVFVEIPE
jgi:nitrite reductase (NADH) small subunit